MMVLKEEQVIYLNSLSRVCEFPPEYHSPTLNSKVGYKARELTGGVCLYAKEDISKGEVICFGDGSVIDKPIVYSYQIGENAHLVGPGGLDHNCQKPNCRIDCKTNNFIAIYDIKKGEYLTFNYLTTEFDMNTPFECSCGERECFKKIRGFKYLSNKDKRKIINNFSVSTYVYRKYKEDF